MSMSSPSVEKEEFAIVDNNDKYLYTIRNREVMHNNKLFHRSIHIFIETVDNRMVIQKKAPGTENANKWSSSVSGHVRVSESYKMAACREADEELGLKIRIYDLNKELKVEPQEKTGNEFVTLFSYIMDTDKEIIKLESNEVLDVIIAPKIKIIQDMEDNPSKYSPAFLLLMEKYLRS